MLETLFGLSGRKALVLGSTPIGVASRDLMASAGATVEIVDPGVDEGAVDAAFAAFAGRHGGLDILVYATTRIGTYPLTTMTLAQWDAVQDANLRGAFLAFRAAIPLMQARGGGAIIAISTMGSVHPVLKGNGAYGASKAGLNALVRAAALDHAADNIRVNTVLPGAVPVGEPPEDMVRMGGPAMEPGRLMLGMGTAEDVAGAVLYLASPAGRFVTGQALALDGGFLIS